MRCRKCGARAAIHMPQHRLALCEEHFPAWMITQTERTIHKYRLFTSGERLLVAVSGGKDSLALWDILLRLGYEADGLYIDLGIDGGLDYSARSREMAQRFATARSEARLIAVDVAERYGETLPQVTRRAGRRKRPCSTCGLIKRHEMNRVAREEGYDALVTGHNLDDEAATLFGNVLRWQVSYLRRQGPLLPARSAGFVRKAKPFCRFYERETAAYALLEGIDYVYEECPFAAGATSLAHKETLARMEHESPGTKLHFYTNFLRAKREGLLSIPEETRPPLHPCTECGQPTAARDLCAFCRLWERQPATEER